MNARNVDPSSMFGARLRTSRSARMVSVSALVAATLPVLLACGGDNSTKPVKSADDSQGGARMHGSITASGSVARTQPTTSNTTVVVAPISPYPAGTQGASSSHPPSAGRQVFGGENSAACTSCGKGTVTKAVQEALVARAKEAKRCYRDYLIQKPGASVSILVEARINTDGALCDISGTVDDGSDSTVVECVLGVFRKGGFPQPANECAVARLPVQYSPGS